MSQEAKTPQMAGIAFEREAQQRLRPLLAELLDEKIELEAPARDAGIDLIARDRQGRRWLFQVKSTGGPGAVIKAAEYLRSLATSRAIPVLVVPYMTPAGAKAAVEERLNWLDLAGNASIRSEGLLILREGRPSVFRTPGRPSSPFAPKSARISRTFLNDPRRWWRQKELAEVTGLDDGSVSRTVRRLDQEGLLERDHRSLRPSAPGALLDAWADDYRFEAHDTVVGHVSGTGIELARDLSDRLRAIDVDHAFTGLSAAWLLDRFATFRVNSVYVDGDPRDVADRLGVRRNERGANLQLVGPNDGGVFAFGSEVEGVRVVSPVQVYLDLQALPERAAEAAEHLRGSERLWQT